MRHKLFLGSNGPDFRLLLLPLLLSLLLLRLRLLLVFRALGWAEPKFLASVSSVLRASERCAHDVLENHMKYLRGKIF